MFETVKTGKVVLY